MSMLEGVMRLEKFFMTLSKDMVPVFKILREFMYTRSSR